MSTRDGTGESVYATIPEGEQNVMLTATDGQGRFVYAIVTITVGGDGVQFNLTGTWSFMAVTPYINGTYFTQDEPMTGFCDIIQVGATINIVFTDGYLECDPTWICEFNGSGSSVTYELSNSGEVDYEGETLTNVITMIASTPTLVEGTHYSVYEYLDGVSTSTMWFNSFGFTKVK